MALRDFRRGDHALLLGNIYLHAYRRYGHQDPSEQARYLDDGIWESSERHVKKRQAVF